MDNTTSTVNKIDEEALLRAMACINARQISSPVELQRRLRVGYMRTMNTLDELKRRGWITSPQQGEPYSSTPAYMAYVMQAYDPNGIDITFDSGQLPYRMDMARVGSRISALNDIMHAASLAAKNGGLTNEEECDFQKACQKLHDYMQFSSLVEKDEGLLSQIEQALRAAEDSDNGRNADVFIAARHSLLNLRQFLVSAREAIERVELCSTSESRYRWAMEGVRNRITALDMLITAMASEWLEGKQTQ